MDDSNIVAIPHHPPLPRTVSGIFQSEGHPYISSTSPCGPNTSKNPLPIVQATANTGFGRSSEQTPSLAATDEVSPNTAAGADTSVLSLQAADSLSRYSFGRQHRGSFASLPSRIFGGAGSAALPSDTDRCALGIRRASMSYGPAVFTPSTGAPRRDSIASLASTTVSQNHSTSTPGFSSDLPLSSTLKRARRESLASNKSTGSSAAEKSGSGERKYMCEWHGCGQAFDRIEHLNRHKRRHTGEKPYRCLISTCSKLFSRFDNMMQHVGIHTVEGKKTGIPNVKNSSNKGNGRGRARRTSYRGTQDPHEKFRRHVDGVLGGKLAECCILPTDNPDFSNLTLRPLLNPEITTSAATAILELDSPKLEQHQPPKQKKRPRCDSVVDGMDKHLMAAYSQVATSPSPSSSPQSNSSSRIDTDNPPGSGYVRYRVAQPPPSNAKAAAGSSPYYRQHRLSFPALAHPTSTASPASSVIGTHRTSLDMLTSAIRTNTAGISNVRGQPGYRRDMHM